MNAKEAREELKMMKPQMLSDLIDWSSRRVGYAEGYLEALEGSEVKELIEAIKEMIDFSGECYCLSEEESCTPGGKNCPNCIAKDVLTRYQEAITPEEGKE